MWPSGNCTSTTGPNTCRILPSTWVAVVTSRSPECSLAQFHCTWLTALGSLHGIGAADDVEQLLGDVLLPRAVVDLLELLVHAHAGVGGALHRHAPAGVLAGDRLQHGAVDHGLEVARHQQVVQRVRVGL